MTKQEFEQLQSDLESSGKSIKDFITEKGMPVHQYYYWKKRHNNSAARENKSEFIQISSDQQLSSTLRIEYPNGVTLNFQSYPGIKTLRKLIKNKS
jgi:hypothetical protein